VSLAPEPSNTSYWSIDVAGVVAGQPDRFSIVNKGDDATNPGHIADSQSGGQDDLL